MKTSFTALLTLALVALGLAATAVSRLSAGFSAYKQSTWFAYCPWKAEFVLNAFELSKEKVIQINKSTHRALTENRNTLFENNNPIVVHLENPFLGDNCYVEKSNQNETFYELSQLKTHLA